jgi:prevent-host-death family protein
MTSSSNKSTSSRSSKKPRRKAGSTPPVPRPREVPLAEVKDDLSRYLRLAVGGEIVITRHGKPAGVLIGFESEDDWFEYRLLNHPEFLRRVSEARTAIRDGRGMHLEDMPR